MKTTERSTPEINSSSMADIAFLLLIFFLVTTTIVSDKGLFILLPQESEDQVNVNIPQKNLFTIVINADGHLLVEGKTWDQSHEQLKADIIAFILNRKKDPASSDSPDAAIVSFKTSRGTRQDDFIAVLDVIKGAYHSIYSERAGITMEEWRSIADKHDTPETQALYNKGRGKLPNGKPEIPMNISIADPF